GLFDNHMVILTPLPENTGQAIALVTRMWEACGAHVTSLDVAQHDRILAATSHLPHVLAYALVDCLAAMDQNDDISLFSAGGFRDFTRIASSSPEMWADICIANRDELLESIKQFREHLGRITHCIENDDKAGLTGIFSRVKQAREDFLENREGLLDKNRNK
ncbi:MAG: prephenate dehydrogenase dimerization domain-containing protein, partial [Gammaproteobacteria bacterium]